MDNKNKKNKINKNKLYHIIFASAISGAREKCYAYIIDENQYYQKDSIAQNKQNDKCIYLWITFI